MAKVNNTNTNTRSSRNSNSVNTSNGINFSQEMIVTSDLADNSETTRDAIQTRTLQTSQTNVPFTVESSRGSTSPTQSPRIPDQEDIVLTSNEYDEDGERDLIGYVETSFFGDSRSIESSFESRPPFSYDVPEPTNFECKFIYNYFTPDERTNDTGVGSVDLSNIDSPDLTYGIQVQQGDRNLDSIPRYIKVTFSPTDDPYAEDSSDSNISIIEENLNSIITEGAFSNPFFTGIEILDTGVESSIYKFMQGAITLLNIATPEDSALSAAEKLSDILVDGNVTGQSKKLITQFLSNIQSSGLKVAPTDVDPEIFEFASDQISQQTFGTKFNNLFFNDIVSRANRLPFTVFQDEIRALTEPSRTIQNTLAAEAIEYANRADEIDYQNFVPAIEEEDISDPSQESSIVTKIGYVLYKYEVLNDSSTRLIKRYALGSYDQTTVIDSQIRYGATYLYKVRSVFQVQMPVTYYDSTNDNNDEIKLVKFLIASEGSSRRAVCVETSPPPPPQNIRIRLDYKNRIPDIHWQFPFNPQRDIKRFQIFRRNSINEPFTLIAEYDFDDSTSRTSVAEVAQSSKLYRLKYPKLCYLDVGYVRGTSPIYTVACVDAHGMTSNYGPQIQAVYDKFRNRIVQKIISGPGAPKPYPNLYIREEIFLDCAKISGYDRMNIFFDPDYYRVTQYQTPAWDTMSNGDLGSEGPENDLNLISVNPNFETYQIHMVNVDNQKDQLVKIKLTDRSGSPFETDPVAISANNLSFEFGTSGIN